MTEDKCYRHLNLNMHPLSDDVLKSLPDKGHVPVDINLVNKDLVEYMAQRGLLIKNVDVFCSPPGFELGIHVDGAKICERVATNWAYCDEKGSVMQWWKPKSDEKKIVDPSKQESAYGISTTPYALGWLEDEVDFITECEVGQPSLVSIGTPHGMKNRTNSYRKAVSITWLYKGRTLEWNDALVLLEDIIVS